MSYATTTTDNASGYSGGWYPQTPTVPLCRKHLLALPCAQCLLETQSIWCGIHPGAPLPCPWCPQRFNPAPAPESAGGEEPMSLIDERQVEVLDAFRAARDTAKRHAQSKVDRATMMKIQAEALIAEARELVAELNEDTPYPMEQGADIGPVKGAGGDRR